MKKFAFTLAETLIVMGIIGVVAALTLPNLNSSTGEKEKVAKVKKIYSNLEDALGRAQAVYGPYEEWCVNYSGSCKDRVLNRISEFLKTSKLCTISDNCVFTIASSSDGSGDDTHNGALLADGTVFVIPNSSEIRFDIDGTNKGPNITGKDTFTFHLNQNGISLWSFSDNSYVFKDEYGYYGDQAATWIINFDNMDYLKTTDGTTCPDGKTKLTFGGNHSCK